MKPILNYTTQIDYWKTLTEIQQMLAHHGVRNIQTTQMDKVPVALIFTMDTGKHLLNFKLPCNYNGILRRLREDKKVPKKNKTHEQALRVGWRIIKDWVEAQLALVHAECVTMEEVFLPYLIISGTGKTVYETLENKGYKLLS